VRNVGVPVAVALHVPQHEYRRRHARAPPTLVLPAGETTRIVLRAADVVHAFYVSDFLFQRQAIRA
jgi:heme/copper-type cytochrome/quinol oxidase subunit 2